MAETLAVEKWMVGLLLADSALSTVVGTRIYSDEIPEEVLAAYPCVKFDFLSGTDFNLVGAVRMWSDMLYIVRGIDETLTYGGNLKTIADRIDAVLHRASGTTSEGTVWACVRENPFRLSEPLDSGRFKHLGGTYRFLAK
jgi:hypothetical protein